ncbi:anti-sigma factor RsbA family regulatory protein [Symbioplanes lichenis]|uniref:anti-sigma factor RsbA family regulatory protein n=1 Tax=Symbioplanes lichenis TaxID=1629072 RepID=UPI002739C206|nr:anti-sigma factor RsbA family regulatory protein [Actinoplanes lichenis]
MRSGAATGHQGCFHEALPYSSGDELLSVVIPFLLDGVAAGEPAVVALGAEGAALVRAALPVDSGVLFLPVDAIYTRPAGAIRAYRELLGHRVARGAAQVRVAGELPRPALGRTWDWWARYEAAINHAFDDFPLWTLCAYDTRHTSAAVLADVARTHPRFILPGDRHEISAAYTEPRTFLMENRPLWPDPVQQRAPLAELTDPTPAQARQAVRAAAAGLTAEACDDLVVAVSETVTNALRYGHPPARLSVWSGDDRVLVAVTDAGEGPKDPFAGLLPHQDSAPGGRGLWITYQACDHVATVRDETGWTIRMIAGEVN